MMQRKPGTGKGGRKRRKNAIQQYAIKKATNKTLYTFDI